MARSLSLSQRVGLRLLGMRAPERKMTATAPAILSLGPYQARWMQSDYDTYAREGYIGNPYVFACIRQIAMAVAGVQWEVFDGPDKKTKYDEHPYLSLLKRPNAFMGGSRFWENMVGYLYLDGNGYIERVGPDSGPPVELWPLRPDRIRIVPGTPQQLISGYVYSVGNQEVSFPAPHVQHYKFWHPTSDWYGLSPLQAASKSVDQSNQAKAWNVALLQNGAQPSGMVSTQALLSDDQYRRLRETIEEKYAGFINAGRPILLEGGATWQEMGMSPKDMAWLEGQNLSAREIAMVFNIAPELIGDPASKTFSNYGEARVALYQETVLPLMDWFRDDLNNWLSPLYDGAYADYNKSDIEALQENRGETYTRINAAFTAGWMTFGMAQEEAGKTVDPEVKDLYRWQAPQWGATDPTAPEPETPALAAPGLPHPELPATHPLNMAAPLIPNDNAEAEPALPPGKNGDAAGTGGGGSNTSDDAAKADTITIREMTSMLLGVGRLAEYMRANPTEPLERVVEAHKDDPVTQAILPFLAAARAAEEARNG